MAFPFLKIKKKPIIIKIRNKYDKKLILLLKLFIAPQIKLKLKYLKILTSKLTDTEPYVVRRIRSLIKGIHKRNIVKMLARYFPINNLLSFLGKLKIANPKNRIIWVIKMKMLK